MNCLCILFLGLVIVVAVVGVFAGAATFFIALIFGIWTGSVIAFKIALTAAVAVFIGFLASELLDEIS